MPSWLARGPEIPNLVHETLKLAARGRINATIASDDLDRIGHHIARHNRRVPGAILTAGLLVASSVLAAFDVGPWFQTHSLPAMLGFAAAIFIGFRAFRG